MKQLTPLSDDEIVAALRSVDVPDPSPLFWDHLSQRVREAIADEPAPAPAWRSRFTFVWTAGVVGAFAVIVLAVMVTVRHPAPVAVPSADREVTDAASVDSGLSPFEDDASWAVMGDLASEMDWDEAGAAGLIATPGAADGALRQLSQDERRAVVDLLQQELKNSKSL